MVRREIALGDEFTIEPMVGLVLMSELAKAGLAVDRTMKAKRESKAVAKILRIFGILSCFGGRLTTLIRLNRLTSLDFPLLPRPAALFRSQRVLDISKRKVADADISIRVQRLQP